MKAENENRVVFAVFKNPEEIEQAVEMLKDAGFRNADISALLPTGATTKELAVSHVTKAPEGASAGAVSGVVLGGALGWLIGAGSIVVPGLGALIAAGPLLSALAGAGALGSLGVIAGALVGLGIPEYEAERYEGYVTEGGMLLSVHADNREWQERAEEIMTRCGGFGISHSKESSSDSPSELERDKPRTEAALRS
jgi:hypothetical protein